MSVPETKTHLAWLRRTVKNWVWSIEDHFDNIKVYEAIGVKLPKFIYDAPPAEEMPERTPARTDPAFEPARYHAFAMGFYLD